MRATGLVFATVGLLASCALAAAKAPPMSFEGAKWIWSSSSLGEDGRSYPAEVRFFRAALTLPQGTQVTSAELIVTCDNMFVLFLNGKLAGESEASNNCWGNPRWFDVAGMLVPGRNVIAVEAVNTLPGPAGLIAKLVVRLGDGRQAVRVTDASWKFSDEEVANWHRADFDDKVWADAYVVADFGAMPWRKPTPRGGAVRAGGAMTAARRATSRAYEALKASAKRGGTSAASTVTEIKPDIDYPWPEAVVYVGADCSLYRPHVHAGNKYDSLSVTIFNPRKSRAFPEHDLPAPMKVGRKLYALRPARPGSTPQLLLDAGKGAMGSPSVSFDGKWIYLSMAYDGEPFFHIYRLPAEGGKPERLTDGPFHDIDPAELPDGRVVFTSTRMGTFEEYHSPPSRALFVMSADGSGVRPLTYTFIFDNEPEVLADGRILFIRSDNFFDRGKVETLLHAVHPDGGDGYTEFGLDRGPEYGGRLRAFHCGSPAPMPDGRVAFVSNRGITIGRPGSPPETWQHLGLPAGGVAALPDGRLLCTLPRRVPVEIKAGRKRRKVMDFRYQKIAIVDPKSRRVEVAILHDSEADGDALHSPVYLGARPRPPVLSQRAKLHRAGAVGATGFLFCQNARFTRQTTAGWRHVRAIRVLAGKGLTVRSSHSYIVHAGSEVIELGTVPLAPDGSFAVEVPADTALAFQAVDAEGRSELNEMSWIYVRPGERRSCLGCHHPRQAVPSNVSESPLALQARPLKLVGQGSPHRFRGNNAAVTGLMNMQFDRYREVAGINRHGDTADPSATGAQEVAALVGQLKGDDEGLRISAAQRLSIFRDPAAAPALAERLRDASREARVAAAIALAACGTRQSVPPLLDALTDRDALVRQAAAVALENLTGHAEPFDPFGDTQTQQARAWRAWFGKTDWAAIERELAERMKSDDRGVVRRAAVALGHVGGDAARVALRAYVARERGNNPLPEWRKKHRGDGARFNALSPVNPRTLQAATRALGYLKDTDAVPLLAGTLGQHSDPGRGNLFLAEACVEALGRIATPEAEAALIAAFAKLQDYPRYTSWYGDHGALMACHASPVHYFIAEALDAMGSTRAASIVPHLIRSVPTDPDRALLLPSDDCETLTGRVIRRSGAEAAVVETCLAILGDPDAKRTKAIEEAIARVHRCWGGHPDPQNRAAQVLSLICRDRRAEPRIRAAFERYRARPVTIHRVFDKGIPVVLTLPEKHWVCFYLARTLGNLADPRSADGLIAALEQSPPEGASGHPDPLGPGVLFLHNDLTPCWRAAVAWALGRIGDKRAAPVLTGIVKDLKNAPDTRHAAAQALGRIADPASLDALHKLAESYPEVSTRRALLETCAALAARRPAPARP